MCWAVVYFSPRSFFTEYLPFLKKFLACSVVRSLQPIRLKGENRHDAHVDPAAHLGGCSHYLPGFVKTWLCFDQIICVDTLR